MLVRDVMTPDPETVGPDDNLQTALDKMAAAGCRRLPVVDGVGALAGIITDRDIRLASNSPLVMRERWQDELLMRQTVVNACMTPDPVSVAQDAPLQDAVHLLLQRKISGLPVVDGQQLVGVITVTDLLRTLVHLLDRA
ncbi:MAG: CBS domain-containing protein [Chloroflexi bacterium]|nr:CBS domain-containing protein [Chloroflexota bacterium]